MKNIILTGDRPTGKLHLGHYVGSLKNRVRLQNEGNYNEYYVMIADAQALTDNYDNPKKIKENIKEVLLDYLAVGLDPSKCTIFVQSGVSALTEFTFYYMNMVTLPRLLRNPTVKSEIEEKKFKGGIPVGFATYPISQAADITAFKTNILVECKSVLPDSDIARRLVGIDGNAKMSKSLNNCIYLSDEEDVIKSKVYSIKTTSRRVEEPGVLEGNILFIYLEAFCIDEHFKLYYNEFNNLEELKIAYQKGGIGDSKIKNFLFNIINNELKPIREIRKLLEENLEYLNNVLNEGTRKAKAVADNNLQELKEVIGINYFDI